MLVVFELDTSNQENAANVLCALTTLLVPEAVADIRKGNLSPLYSSGVKYHKQNPKACAFRMPSDVKKRGNGDCKQLVLWRLAELKANGETATPRVMWLNDRKGLQAHILIRRADGNLEDPSVTLGMQRLKDSSKVKQLSKRKGKR
jgi:hypothetical protein